MTPRQREALDIVRHDITNYGLCPDLAEIAAKLGVSRARAGELLAGLVAQGKLKRVALYRGWELPDEPDLRLVDSLALRAELARRGESLDAMARRGPIPSRRAAHCAADGCDEPVRRGHLMCWRHWSMLPARLQAGILAANGARDQTRFAELVTQARELTVERRRA